MAHGGIWNFQNDQKQLGEFGRWASVNAKKRATLSNYGGQSKSSVYRNSGGGGGGSHSQERVSL